MGKKVLQRIRSFLTDRYQSVLVEGNTSPPTEILFEVSQGSVLGPLSFLVLISNINEKVTTSSVSSLADDTRIGRQIDTPNNVRASQRTLDTIYEWAIYSQ